MWPEARTKASVGITRSDFSFGSHNVHVGIIIGVLNGAFSRDTLSSKTMQICIQVGSCFSDFSHASFQRGFCGQFSWCFLACFGCLVRLTPPGRVNSRIQVSVCFLLSTHDYRLTQRLPELSARSTTWELSPVWSYALICLPGKSVITDLLRYA